MFVIVLFCWAMKRTNIVLGLEFQQLRKLNFNGFRMNNTCSSSIEVTILSTTSLSRKYRKISVKFVEGIAPKDALK